MNERKPICASKGKWLTNGETYGKQIYLAEGIDPATFYEITDEEYAQILEAEQNELIEEE